MAAGTRTIILGFSTGIILFGFGAASMATLFNYIADSTGTYWGIQDAAPPHVDTGSIRATPLGSGQNAGYTTSIHGFGGIRVLGQSDPAPRFNGEVMRGFGLRFDGADRVMTTRRWTWAA